jgi:GAF domain-containing protein
MAKISLSTLKDLVPEEGISDAELQVLSLALDGKSPTDIKAILGISSENAVQKKLARIYAKFRISGSGPGKLPKLQKILTDRLQAKQGKRRVLLCLASSYESQQIEGIYSIFKHPQIEIVSPDVEININSGWFTEVDRLLKDLDFCIVCLTKEFLENSYAHFAVGFLAGRVENLTLLCFGQTLLSESFLHLPLIDGTDKDSLAQLLHKIISGDKQDSQDWVNFKLSAANWLDTFNEIQSAPLDKEHSLSYKTVVEAGNQLIKNNTCVRNNQLFNELITGVLVDVSKQVEAVGSGGRVYSIPLELYPRYLVFLQQHFKPIVKAVAVIHSVEHFWGADEGDEIGESANAESERLFVFPDEASFNKGASFLLKHAWHYKVFVTTWEIYEPLAAEFAIRGTLTQWKDNDYSLPTREYAIIKTENFGQLLAWYDQDAIKSSRSDRVMNFSAIREQAVLYEDAFDRLVKAQGVFLFRPHDSPQDKVVEELDRLKDGLFRRALPTNFRMTPERLLENLQKFRNDLIHSEQTSLDDRRNAVIQTALQRVREMLHAQIASIYLFAKDGRLHRLGIEGVDDLFQSIDHQTFYVGESYAVGEGFTGKAAIPADNGYGQPQWTNQLYKEDLGGISKTEYSRNFKLQCAIAVPLNGQSKTYGVLEIINKVDPKTGKPLDYCSISPNEISLLSAIGSFVATALSNLRRDKQNKLYADLSDLLIKSPSEDPELQKTYDSIVRRLISEETAFEVCILRIKTRGELVVRAKTAVERVKWETRQDQAIKPGDGLVGKTFQLGQPVLIESISERIKQFKSKDWIKLNKFESFGCFPLIYKEDVVGTLSLYTGYKYEFHRSSREFLGRVSSLIAAFIGKIIESEVVRDVVNQLDGAEQSIDTLTLAKARKELNNTFIKSSESNTDNSDDIYTQNPAGLMYLD